MAAFDLQFSHDTMILLAEAAYNPNLTAAGLPAGYSIVGPIEMDAVATIAARAPLPPQHARMLARMQATGKNFGWLLENTSSHTVVLAFRGTLSLEDWLHDLDFFPAAYSPVPDYGTVHQGFQVAYLAVRNSVVSQFKKISPGYTRVIITGHSLGAALSELAAPDLLHNFGLRVPPEVHNFAGPRVGHHDFSSLFDVQIDVCFRVVNTWDIVPSLPPPLALFEHVGTAVHVDGGFTLNELVAHSMEKSYGPGLAKLMPQAAARVRSAAVAATNFPQEMLVGREP